jgi:hypothetical protein
MKRTIHRQSLALVVATAVVLAVRGASAEPVVDQALADAQMVVQKGCAILKVNFNIRIRYASHFPLDHGDELRITVNPIDRKEATALLGLKREAATVPADKRAGVNSIVLETANPTGPVLRINFDRPVAYQVAADSDTQSIVVAIAGAKPSPTCKPVFPGSAAIGSPGNRPPGRISPQDLRSVAAWMDEGRAALHKNNPRGAIQLFSRILGYPENQYSAEAQEFLALAYQKNGQTAEARAQYEDYLRRYPIGEASDRVRQRLTAIAPNGEASGPLRTPPAMLPAGKFTRSGETTWTLVGSASAFYIRNDSFTAARDPTLAPNPNVDPDTHRVHQNEILSSLDATATWNNDQTKGKIRFSGSEEHMFSPSSRDLVGVAAFSVETLVKDWNVRSVFGRQTLNTDGVLGRFDGALLSWQPLTMLRLDLVAGSPALSRFDLPFKDDKYFYSAGVGLGPFFGGFDTTLYVTEQRDRWLVDREAVGMDARYFDANKFMFGNVDYDIHFNRLNAAIFSGSWILPDQSTIYGGADYRRTPYLSTWNALLNQPFATLYDLLKANTSAPLQQLALEQTPIYKSAMIGFSHPLNDKLQVSADATVVNLTQPLAPVVGLDPALAALPAGNEYYYSTQLIANNIMRDGDMYIAALRYSQMTTSNMYVLDFNSRFPVTPDVRISPRLRLGYTMGRGGTALTEYTVLPSVLVDYQWTKNLSLELEVGAQWTNTLQSGIKSQTTDLLATMGIRYDFYTDGNSKPSDEKSKFGAPAASALCRYSARPDGSCSQSAAAGR